MIFDSVARTQTKAKDIKLDATVVKCETFGGKRHFCTKKFGGERGKSTILNKKMLSLQYENYH